ncbi:MAG: hypothetical protein JXD22_01130 [Sedimentisphaerales bacterium]|nr:hypothetical protein [Sedimentisphaerales bacterium]
MNINKSKQKQLIYKGLGVLAAVAVVVVLLFKTLPGGQAQSGGKGSVATYKVNRGNLTISVTESGNISARKTTDIKSEVEGRATLVSLVPEGTMITQEDVDNGMILVELDSSQITEQLNRQEIDYSSAKANLTEAKESLEIQKKQNESDITAGEMKVEFALMDLQKYVGNEIADQMVAQAGSEVLSEADIELLINEPNLLCDTTQKWLELKARIEESEERLKRAREQLIWTKKLYEREFVARNDLEADQLSVMQNQNTVEQAKISLELFKKYEFPKQAVSLLADYQESKRELERTHSRARSRLAQGEAQLKNVEQRFLLEEERLDKLKKQLEACVIKAPTPGLVVYGEGGDSYRRRNDPIEVGVEVYERQTIMRIPNTTEMTVDTKVHETSRHKVQVGQLARVTVEALPDAVFWGEVLKVSPLPDSQRGWLNPDMKVYNTVVSISDSPEVSKLSTGMTAKVEIIIEDLKNVLYVPVQAVTNDSEGKVCYTQSKNSVEPKQVETGSFNESFVVINQGIQEGDIVTLTPPRVLTGDSVEKLAERSRQKFDRSDSPSESTSSATESDKSPGSPEEEQKASTDQTMGPSAEMMKKFQDPEFQTRMRTARREGRLEEFFKEEGLELPPQMLEAMKRRPPRGAAAAAGESETSVPSDGQDSRSGAPSEGRAQRPNRQGGGQAGGGPTSGQGNRRSGGPRGGSGGGGSEGGGSGGGGSGG